MVNNFYEDKKGRYEIAPTTIETVDQAVNDYFNLKLNLKVETERGLDKALVIFEGGERWALIKKKDINAFRDEHGTLRLPAISIQRTNISGDHTFGGMAQEVPEITVAKQIHKETSFIRNLEDSRRRSGFPRPRKETIYEYTTLPYPDFRTFYYTITVWSQYQSQMNEMLEKILYKYDYRDSFVMPVEYDGKEPKGEGYYFVGFRDGDITPQSNTEDFTDQERILKYEYTIKTPVYLMLDPKEEALSYGKDEDGKKVVHKHQSVTNISYKETVLTKEEFEKLFG